QLLMRRNRRDDPVLGPFKIFADLDDNDFANQAQAVLSRLDERRRRAINPFVLAAFQEAPAPASLEEVADIYAALFAKFDSRRKAFLAANEQALAAPVTGFDPAETKLFELPLKIAPASEVNTASLRDFIGK